MIKIIEKHGMFRNRPRGWPIHTIVLHHTAGGTLSGAEATLKKRGLGYHYMIDKDGQVYEYVRPNRFTAHAYRRNVGTVGISYVGGGKYGAINLEQRQSLIKLMKVLKEEFPRLKKITGHKHVDPRGWKCDPRFPGEPELGVNWAIDKKYMNQIAEATDMVFVSKTDKNRWWK